MISYRSVEHLLAYAAFGLIAAHAAVAEEAATADTVLEEVTVTGTRLGSSAFNAPTPVSTVSAADIEAKGVPNIADAINSMPQFMYSAGPANLGRNNSTQTAGQNILNLRGLGGTRALILVDGRRHVATNQTQTIDTSMIPSSLIERVEVVTGGASAAYGSDAVAGVVNFILKDKIEGFTANLQAGQSQYNDNREYIGSFAGGASAFDDRAHFVFGVEAAIRKGTGNMYARDWGRLEPGGPVGLGATRPAGTPSQGFFNGVEYSQMFPGSIITNATANRTLAGIAFDAQGNPYRPQLGPIFGTLQIAPANSANYGVNQNTQALISFPQDRAVLFGRGTFDVTEKTHVFVEASHGEYVADSPTSISQVASLVVPITNPYIPASVRTAMQAQGLTQITIGRTGADWASALGTSNNTYLAYKVNRGVVGARGEFALFGRDWNWDTYYQMGKTRLRYEPFSFKVNNLAAAVWSTTDANGTPVCRTDRSPSANTVNAAATPGCVPYNPFGLGQASAASYAYIAGGSQQVLNNQEEAAELNLRGDLVDLPAGPLAAAVGAGWRRDKFNAVADAGSNGTAYAVGNPQSFDGQNTVKEFYTEVGAPLLKGMTLVKSLDLNAAARRTNYDVGGGVTTWKGGLTWDVTDSVRLRGTRSRDIRMASLFELFYKAGGTLQTTPVNPWNNVTGSYSSATQGNPNLTPEIADTVTGGIVLHPEGFLSGLNVSIDYWSVKIDKVIASLSSAQVIQNCFATATIKNNTVAGVASGDPRFCGRIVTDSSAYGISFVNSQYENLNQLHTRGIDLEIAYELARGALHIPGQFGVRLLGTRVGEIVQVVGGVPTDYVGTAIVVGVPRWTGDLTLSYGLNRFNNSLNFHGFTSVLYDPTLIGPDDSRYSPTLSNSINVNRFPGFVYMNWNGSFDLIKSEDGKHKLQINGVVNNVFDRAPPQYAWAAFAFGHSDPYDMVGRQYRLGVRFNY